MLTSMYGTKLFVISATYKSEPIPTNMPIISSISFTVNIPLMSISVDEEALEKLDLDIGDEIEIKIENNKIVIEKV
ncbi:MAG: AbrB/MazE/SpoVT family DNA-binding domain-containing protein [Thermoproteus sp.]|nr:AbrB/MazE/SpoVT family DNA-binding domain-containing protein [Thermoproteus sp.]